MRRVLLVGVFILSVFSSVVTSKSRLVLKQEQEPEFLEQWEVSTSSNTMPTEWPQVAGREAKEVVLEIQEQNPSLKVVAVKEGSPVTMDHRTDRVRVFFNTEGFVVGKPKVG